MNEPNEGDWFHNHLMDINFAIYTYLLVILKKNHINVDFRVYYSILIVVLGISNVKVFER